METKSLRNWTLVLAIAFLLLAMCVTYLHKDKLINLHGSDTSEQVQDTDTVIDTPTEYTIQDILQLRDEFRESKRIDSVFLTMPQVALINILMQHGTNLSITDIVYIYESNPETYKNVLDGAKAQKYMDSIAIKEQTQEEILTSSDSIK